MCIFNPLAKEATQCRFIGEGSKSPPKDAVGSSFADIHWWIKCLILENTCVVFFHKLRRGFYVISKDPSSNHVA